MCASNHDGDFVFFLQHATCLDRAPVSRFPSRVLSSKGFPCTVFHFPERFLDMVIKNQRCMLNRPVSHYRQSRRKVLVWRSLRRRLGTPGNRELEQEPLKKTLKNVRSKSESQIRFNMFTFQCTHLWPLFADDASGQRQAKSSVSTSRKRIILLWRCQFFCLTRSSWLQARLGSRTRSWFLSSKRRSMRCAFSTLEVVVLWSCMAQSDSYAFLPHKPGLGDSWRCFLERRKSRSARFGFGPVFELARIAPSWERSCARFNVATFRRRRSPLSPYSRCSWHTLSET